MVNHLKPEPDTASQPGGSTPVPDPTKLTTEAVDRLKETLKELFGARFEHVEKALDRLQMQLDTRPAAIVQEIAHLRGLMDEKFRTIDERFKGVDQQFAGRDTALAAALLAQKTSVEEQNKANALATSKSEAGFTKQIDGATLTISASAKSSDEKIEVVKSLIQAGQASADDKIEDVRNRIGALENQKKGASDNWAGIAAAAALVLVVIGIIGGVIALSGRSSEIVQVPVMAATKP